MKRREVFNIKPKAMFLSNSGQKGVHSAYSADTLNQLSDLLDLDDTVYDIDSLDAITASQAEIIFSTWGMPQFSESEVRQNFPKAKILFYAAGSVQDFAAPFLNCGIRVVSAWAANAIPVAEFTFAQIILANKGYLQNQHAIKEQGYNVANAFTRNNSRGTFDCTLGIIGAGMIGKKVIEMFNACGVRVNILVYDPFLSEDTARSLGVTFCSLEELFKESHVISNHLANNPQTVGILSYDLFRHMKPSATFINTGRGAQVVEADLIRALNEFPTRSAFLDVTDPEPPVEGHAFYSMHNVFLTSHISGSFGDETYRLGEFMLDELKSYLERKELEYEVTLQMLETMA